MVDSRLMRNIALTKKVEVPVAGVFDLGGRRIATLAEGSMAIGLHSLTWNAETSPTGVYFVRIKGPNGVRVAKMALVR